MSETVQFSVEVETSKPARSLQEVWCKTSGERNIGVAALSIRVSQQTKRWVQKKWKRFSVHVISGAVRNMLCKPVFEEKKAEYVFLCNWYCYFFPLITKVSTYTFHLHFTLYTYTFWWVFHYLEFWNLWNMESLLLTEISQESVLFAESFILAC